MEFEGDDLGLKDKGEHGGVRCVLHVFSLKLERIELMNDLKLVKCNHLPLSRNPCTCCDLHTNVGTKQRMKPLRKLDIANGHSLKAYPASASIIN